MKMIKDKYCRRCNKLLPATSNYFFKNYFGSDGLTTFCRNCKGNFKSENFEELNLKKIPDISDEQAAFYQKVADSLSTKHIIKNQKS